MVFPVVLFEETVTVLFPFANLLEAEYWIWYPVVCVVFFAHFTVKDFVPFFRLVMDVFTGLITMVLEPVTVL